jgi:hypothetical protein
VSVRLLVAACLLPLVPLLALVRAGWLRGGEHLAVLFWPAVTFATVFFGLSWLTDRLFGGER